MELFKKQSTQSLYLQNAQNDLRTPEEIVEHQKPFGASPRTEKKQIQ
jgi:hypothetical protein